MDVFNRDCRLRPQSWRPYFSITPMFRMLLSLESAGKCCSLISHRAIMLISCSPDGSELPRAYIVPQKPERATPEVAEQIKSWLAERVSRAKRLDGGVHFVTEIPKNPVSA